jgi:hypothetical protein
MNNEQNPFDGFEVISCYSRAQALEDGVLVDISLLAREAGFPWPIAVTRAVWEVLDPGEELKEEGQSWTGRAWDMLFVLRMSLGRSRDGREVSFSPLFVRRPGGVPEPVALRAVSGPGDSGEPVLTIMLPDED